MCMCVYEMQFESAHARRNVLSRRKKRRKMKRKKRRTEFHKRDSNRSRVAPGDNLGIVHQLCARPRILFSSPANRALRNLAGIEGGGEKGGLRLGNTSFSSYHTRNLARRNQRPVEVSLASLAMYLPSSNFPFSPLSPFDKN